MATVFVEDTRVFRGADISSDHYLVLSKIKLIRRYKKSTNWGKYIRNLMKFTYSKKIVSNTSTITE
jgi:hypothetical protein